MSSVRSPIDVDALTDERSDPAARSVLEDLARSSGARVTRLGTAIRIVIGRAAADADAAAAAADAAADAAAAAADADAADDDAADDAAADAAAADADAAAAYAAADAAAADAAAAAADAAAADDDDDDDADDDDADDDDADAAISQIGTLNSLLFDGDDMKDGLKIIQIPGSWRGYSVTIAGWLQRVGGDEWIILPGYRVVIRTGVGRGLHDLAADGPKRDYKLLEPSEGPEEIHRLLIGRPMPAKKKAWVEHVGTLAQARKLLAAFEAEEAAA